MLTRLDRAAAVVLIVDLQDKLLPAIAGAEACVAASAKLVAGAKVLGVPVLATEQYPAGLGRTCPEIATLMEEMPKPVEKMAFSACVPAILDAIALQQRQQIIIAGIETHVCVQQTVLDLLRRGLPVWVCADAVGSRRDFDRDIALKRMRHAGAIVTSVESVLFELLGEAGPDAFKKILKIVK